MVEQRRSALLSSAEEGNGSSGLESCPRTAKVHAMKIPANNASLAPLHLPNFPVPVDLEKGDGWYAIAARPECGRQAVNQEFLHKTNSLKRAAILPTGAQHAQLIFNFERIRNIDLRRCIFSRGHRPRTS